MKIKAFLFILFIYFLSAKVLGQGYNPFPITNATWIEYSLFDDPDLLGFAWNEESWKYFIIGDTLIQNQSYSKLYCEGAWRYDVNHPEGLDTLYYLQDDPVCIGGIRELNRRVYFKSFVNEIPYGCNFEPFDTVEFLLYDFNILPGDSVSVANWPYDPFLLLDTSTIQLADGSYRKTYDFDEFSWIEGIGCTKGLLRPLPQIPEYAFCNLNCFKNNDTLLLSNIYAPYCDSIPLGYKSIQAFEPTFSIYPLPLVSAAQIEFGQFQKGELKVVIRNLNGEQVFSDQIELLAFYTLERSYFPSPGFYLVTLYDTKTLNESTKKILVMD